MLLARARLLVIVLWAGSLWTVGYLVAPTLFGTLADRVLAGTIAGSIFRSQAWLSLACGCLVLVLSNGIEPKARKSLRAVAVAMLLCQAIGYFGLQPMMASIKAAAPGGVMDEAARSRFGLLHGVSAVVYLAQSLLAAVLVIKNK